MHFLELDLVLVRESHLDVELSVFVARIKDEEELVEIAVALLDSTLGNLVGRENGDHARGLPEHPSRVLLRHDRVTLTDENAQVFGHSTIKEFEANGAHTAIRVDQSSHWQSVDDANGRPRLGFLGEQSGSLGALGRFDLLVVRLDLELRRDLEHLRVRTAIIDELVGVVVDRSQLLRRLLQHVLDVRVLDLSLLKVFLVR